MINLNDETKISFEKRHWAGGNWRGKGVSQKILELKPDIVIAYRIGPGALARLKNRVKIYKAEGKTVEEVISAFRGWKTSANYWSWMWRVFEWKKEKLIEGQRRRSGKSVQGKHIVMHLRISAMSITLSSNCFSSSFLKFDMGVPHPLHVQYISIGITC